MQQIESFIHALPSGMFDRGPDSDEGAAQQTSPRATTFASSSIGLSTLSPQQLINPGQFFNTLPRSDSYEDATHYQSHQRGPFSSSYLYTDDQGATRWQGEM